MKNAAAEKRVVKYAIEAQERDRITGLYTQAAFLKRAEWMLRENWNIDYDVIVVDIERFKIVNDIYGIDEGDRLLKALSQCVLTISQEGLSLFTRASADKFYALVPRGSQRYQILDRNITELVENYPLPMRIQIKFGVYQIKNREIGIIRMCDRAVLATNSIKGIYDCRYTFYDESIRDKMVMEQKIIDTMLGSLERGDFQVYLQPKIEIATKKCTGAETLVRWNHPEYGMIEPAKFIPLFEKSGFICSLDQYVWEKVCQIVYDWKERNGFSIPVSVNVSRIDAFHCDLVKVFQGLIEKYGLQPEELHLEVTESAYIEDSGHLISVMKQLQNLGFIIEMDDFGKGYSSLNALSGLPVEVLKMDMDFLKEDETEDRERKQKVMKFVIALARELGLQVIAEGVETETQTRLLQSIGCQYAQGYLYGKPMPEKEFLEAIQ